MFFIQLNVGIDWREERPLYTTDAVYAHAAVMQAITTVDGPLGRSLHDMRRDKPLNLAFVDNHLRISLVGKNALQYLQALLIYWHTTPTMTLQDQDCAITGIDLNGSGGGQVHTWSDFTTPLANKQLRFTFLSPTALTRQDSQRQRYTIPFPEPVSLFTTLAEQWQVMGGCPLPAGLEEYLVDGGCVIKRYRLHTVTFPVEKRQQIGFLGDVTFLCRQPDKTYIQALNWLTRFAPFVGVGYQTARGMGAVSTELFRQKAR